MLCLFVSQVAYISETSKELQNNDKTNESSGFCLSRKFSEKMKRFLLVNSFPIGSLVSSAPSTNCRYKFSEGVKTS